ncbi:RRXRR domain-containing protein, partial [Lachnospiraceae bacterium PAL227]
MVYVISREGQPLMPTTRHGKVKHLLREGKAKVVKRCPFTIQLMYESTTHAQPIALGVDAGSKTVGLSATTETEELYASETE